MSEDNSFLRKLTEEFDYSHKTSGNAGKFWYQRYSKDQVLYRKFAFAKYQRLLSYLKGGETMLDIGTGFGDSLFLFRDKFQQLVGIDPSNEMVEIAKQNMQEHQVEHAAVKHGLAEKVDFPDSYFDTILMLDIYEHLHPENLDLVLSEQHRLLKPEGELILITPSRRQIRFWSFIDNLMQRIFARKKIPLFALPVKKHTEIFYSKREVLSRAGSAGLKLKRFETVSFYPAPERKGFFHQIWIRARKYKVSKFIITGLFDICSRMPFLRQKMLFVFSPTKS